MQEGDEEVPPIHAAESVTEVKKIYNEVIAQLRESKKREKTMAEPTSYCRFASVDISVSIQSNERFLSKLRRAVNELQEKHYDEYKNKKRPKELSPTLPANGVFNGRDLEFTAAFSKRPLMFLADWKSKDREADEKVIVKFCEGGRYGEEVHKFCWEQGIAPKCHGVRKVGPFKMIVMEKCDEICSVLRCEKARRRRLSGLTRKKRTRPLKGL